MQEGSKESDSQARDTSRLESEATAKTEPRRYHVLEERDLGDIVRDLLDTPAAAAVADMLRGKVVFELMAVTDARNPENAVRAAAKTTTGRSGQMHLIAVSERMFQPLAVWIRTEQLVTVAGPGEHLPGADKESTLETR